MSAEIIDFNEYKYTKLAEEFVNLRKEDPVAAAEFARSKVKPSEFAVLSKYIDAELTRQRGGEPVE